MADVKSKVLEDHDKIQKIIILLANANNEPIKGRIKLQKIIFLLSDKIDEIKEQSSYDTDNVMDSGIINLYLAYFSLYNKTHSKSSDICTEIQKTVANLSLKIPVMDL